VTTDTSEGTESQSRKDFEANPAWVTYLNPFRFVVPDDEEPWEVTLDEINWNTYDHGRLCRIIDRLPTPLGPDWPMLLCYDGALAVPLTARFTKKEDTVEYFNIILCNLFLGGLLCLAIDARDVVWGQLHKKRFLWPVNMGQSVSSQLHAELRMRLGGAQTIRLASPQTVPLSVFRAALAKGAQVTGSVSSLTPKFLLLGITELRNRNWSSALSSLWIVIEQLTDHLWNESFLNNPQYHPTTGMAKRKSGFKDHRTWSTSVKQEVLYQNNIMSEEVLALVFPARQARNDLVHKAKDVAPKSAISACEGAIRLLQQCSSTQFEVDQSMYSPPDERPHCGNEITGVSCFDDWNSIGKE
jgi:hypothetical protein